MFWQIAYVLKIEVWSKNKQKKKEMAHIAQGWKFQVAWTFMKLVTNCSPTFNFRDTEKE